MQLLLILGFFLAVSAQETFFRPARSRSLDLKFLGLPMGDLYLNRNFKRSNLIQQNHGNENEDFMNFWKYNKNCSKFSCSYNSLMLVSYRIIMFRWAQIKISSTIIIQIICVIQFVRRTLKLHISNKLGSIGLSG